MLLLLGRGHAPARVRDTLVTIFIVQSVLASAVLAATGTEEALPPARALARARRRSPSSGQLAGPPAVRALSAGGGYERAADGRARRVAGRRPGRSRSLSAPCFVQITDSHVDAGDGADAASRRARRRWWPAIAALPVAPDAVAGQRRPRPRRATARTTRSCATLLAPLPCPSTPSPATTTTPALLYEALRRPGDAEVGGPAAAAVRHDVPGHDARPRSTSTRLAARLAGDDRPTVVAMHHPPLRTGIEAIDAIGCRSATAAAPRRRCWLRSPQVAARRVRARAPHHLRDARRLRRLHLPRDLAADRAGPPSPGSSPSSTARPRLSRSTRSSAARSVCAARSRSRA